MKSKFTNLGLMAILLSACSTGSYVTSSYTDDIYFNPGDVPPPIGVTTKPEQKPAREKSASTIIVSAIGENEEGENVMNNYIFDGTERDANALQYNVEQGLEGSDTTIYYNDDEVKYVINNYYDDNGNVDFAYRINRFHNPYFYDPFYWDSWYYDPFYSYGYGYYPGWSFAFNRGWGSPYYGWGSPYYGWGSSYYGWGYPGYGWGGYYSYGSGYYSPYWGGGYYQPIYTDSDNYQYGQRRSSGTNVARGGGGSSNVAQTSSGRIKSGGTEVASGTNGTGRNTSSSSGRREASEGNVTTKWSTPNTNILTERRRSTESSSYMRSTGVENSANTNRQQTQTQNYTRPGASTQSRTYTRPSSSSPSVTTQPRVVNQSSVNRSSSSGYSQPKSTSTYNQTYRSSSTYNRSTSTGTSSRSYSSPASSSGNYNRSSAPASSSSSGSYNSSSSGRSSGSYSSGSSGSSGGGSYSGGSSSGGGSRSSGGGSSSSGRR